MLTEEKVTSASGNSDIDREVALQELFVMTLSHYRHDLEILKNINDVIVPLAEDHSQKMIEQIQSDVPALEANAQEEYYTYLDSLTNGHETVRVTDQKAAKILSSLFSEIGMLRNTPIFIREMCLGYIISSFEDYLADTLKTVIEDNPEILLMSEKKLEYKDILKHKDMYDLKEAIVDDEVRTLMHKDIEDINYYLGRFKLDLSKENDWKVFKEAFYRRNIVIHNRSSTDAIYCKKTGYTNEGEYLEVDQAYLNNTLSVFDKYALKITDHMTMKFCKPR